MDSTLQQLLSEIYRVTALATALEKQLAAVTQERDELARSLDPPHTQLPSRAEETAQQRTADFLKAVHP